MKSFKESRGAGVPALCLGTGQPLGLSSDDRASAGEAVSTQGSYRVRLRPAVLVATPVIAETGELFPPGARIAFTIAHAPLRRRASFSPWDTGAVAMVGVP